MPTRCPRPQVSRSTVLRRVIAAVVILVLSACTGSNSSVVAEDTTTSETTTTESRLADEPDNGETTPSALARTADTERTLESPVSRPTTSVDAPAPDAEQSSEASSSTGTTGTVADTTNSPASTSPSGSSASSAPTATTTTTTTITKTSSTTQAPRSSTTTATTPTTTSRARAATVPSRIDLPAAVGGVEGIAVDSASGRIFVGDLTNGNVWVGRADDEPYTLFSAGSSSGRSNVLGLTVDQTRRRLYVVANSQNRIDIVDVDTGAHIASASAPGAGTLNDAVVAPDGTVYVSDMGSPKVFRIAPGGTTAELWVDYSGTTAVDTGSRAQHGNGIVADNSSVLVAYMIGGELLRFDRSSGAVTRVQHSGSAITGRDGLVLCGNTLLGVDNASFSGGRDAIWMSRLTGDRSGSTATGTITDSSFSAPSTAAVLDGSLVVVNAQFGVSNKHTPYWLSVVDSPC